MKRISGFLIIILILGLQMGCAADEKRNAIQSATVAVDADVNANRLNIPFKQYLYSKYSPNFSWEKDDSDGLPKEVTDKYENDKTLAPGGFYIKETPTEFFIAVSIGGVKSSTDGFEVKSLSLPSTYQQEKDPILKIEVNRVKNERTSSEAIQGDIFVRSLIGISKNDLPTGVHINSIIMGLEN
ncbi:hypothetical protein [Cohnella abietis]|uniref:Uncharacterized protein n=1 Tax=Cohnella abietis TaxID=2507935 RepID=A0A3T1D665_9BACL|nr:hypothetical protein [Cohnella abietis]BBI33563.1 hypothetical protein KCTCHS21_29620 [Cohnella abietis]